MSRAGAHVTLGSVPVMGSRFVAVPAEVSEHTSDAPTRAGPKPESGVRPRFVPAGAVVSVPVHPAPQFVTSRRAGAALPVAGRAPVGFVDASPDVGGPAGHGDRRIDATALHSATTTAGTGADIGVLAGDAARVRLGLAAEFGPLGSYLVASGVTDLFLNGEEGGLWVDRGDGLRRDHSMEISEREVRDLAVRLIALGGRHIDEATPCVDVRLAGGVRVHAVLPPISVTGTLLSIRVPQVRRHSLAELGAVGMFDATTADVLAQAVADRTNLLITGAAGTGKTTLLGALLATAPGTERIVAIEDVAELGVQHPHFVSLEARQANLEGAGAIGMDRLVREALRMRPDRLVVGECRGAEVRELLAALNTGHDGGAGTLHANSLADVPARVEALGALAGMTQDAVARQTVSAIGLVLHLERVNGARRLSRLGRFGLDGLGRLSIHEVPP